MKISNGKVLASLTLCLLLLPWQICAAVTHQDALTDMFIWWNAAYKHSDGFTAAAFAEHFTPDAVLRVNGVDRCKGLAEWAAHFQKIQASTEMVEIVLPFIDEFESPGGDRIFTHHIVKAREHGKDSAERVMGYAVVKDGKISLINFVSVPDAQVSASGKK